MNIKYKNTEEDYYEALVALDRVKDLRKQRNKNIINAILGWIGWYLILYPFIYGIDRIIGTSIAAILMYIAMDRLDKNRAEKEIKALVFKDYIEVTISESSILIKRNNETAKLLLREHSNYDILELENEMIVTFKEKILLIIPNEVFKSQEEKLIFKSYLIK